MARIETLPAGDWNTLPTEAATVAMFGGLVTGGVLGALSALVLGWPLTTLLQVGWLASIGIGLAWLLAITMLAIWLSWRRWKATGWRLDGIGLHVRRGRAWRREILIPRSRVQHLDIERGPIERHFGLATLVVHTAGTRQHALRQPGLADADAVALRDALVPASDRHDDVV